MLAARGGNVLTVSTLLWASEQSLGSDYLSYVNDADLAGNTALHIASKRGYITVIRILLEEGANPLSVNRKGNSALHLACLHGHAACVELLLDARVRGADGRETAASHCNVRDAIGESRYMDAVNGSGLSPLHLAAFCGSSACVTVLTAKGALLDIGVARALDRLPFLCGGSTPLHIAASQGDARTCAILLEAQWRHPGVELRRIRNILGLTPLNCALLGGYHEVVRVLIETPRRDRSLMRENLPLSSFPESLRVHMISVLQKAALLVYLRDIALLWKKEGISKPKDSHILQLNGITSLSLPKIQRMKMLLENEDVSLRDVLFGLECTLQGNSRSHFPIVRISGLQDRLFSQQGIMDAQGEEQVHHPEGEEQSESAGEQQQLEEQDQVSEEQDCVGKFEFEDCQVCMDDDIEVRFGGCDHTLCFSCTSQLCTKPGDAALCPFCRSPIMSIHALPGARQNTTTAV